MLQKQLLESGRYLSSCRHELEFPSHDFLVACQYSGYSVGLGEQSSVDHGERDAGEKAREGTAHHGRLGE